MDSLTQENKGANNSSKLFWIVMVVGLLASAALIAYFYLSPTPPAQEPRLENAVSEGSPEFQALTARVAVQQERDYATQAESLAGGVEINLTGLIRNFSGKTITGLEVVGSVVDEKGNVLREKKQIVIPNLQSSFVTNNKTAPFSIRIGGFDKRNNSADYRFRITAIRVE